MKYLEKHPMIMILVGILGISMSAIFVKYSTAPSAVTATWRLLWTVILMTPAVLGSKKIRRELFAASGKTVGLSALSGVFLAVHFVFWFESLAHTSVASSTTIVCTEVIWVALGFCLFLKGRISPKATAIIGITFLGSALIAMADSSAGGNQLYGDVLSLVAAVAVAVYTLLGREVRKTVSTSVYTYIVYAACVAVLLGMCWAQKQNILGYGFSAPIVGFLLAVFSTILGHSIFSWCLKFFSPAFVSASKLCEPVAAGIMAAFLFGEMPTMLQLLGGAMVIGGVAAYSRLEGEGRG